MHLDLRYPIGLLLLTYGAILAIQGAVVGAPVLGFNVNLDWGAVMIACGAGVLYLARRHATRAAAVAAAGKTAAANVSSPPVS
jgi:hypothetical protein